MKKIILVILILALIFVSGCEVSDYFGINSSIISPSFSSNKTNQDTANNPPVIEDIKLKE